MNKSSDNVLSPCGEFVNSFLFGHRAEAFCGSLLSLILIKKQNNKTKTHLFFYVENATQEPLKILHSHIQDAAVTSQQREFEFQWIFLFFS